MSQVYYISKNIYVVKLTKIYESILSHRQHIIKKTARKQLWITSSD